MFDGGDAGGENELEEFERGADVKFDGEVWGYGCVEERGDQVRVEEGEVGL